MRFSRTVTAIILATLLLAAFPCWAIRIICPACSTIAELTDEACKKCARELNKCLKCGTLNPVSADFCEGEDCAEPLAEMRLLSGIDEETRNELRLGQSERAQLDRELQSIDYLLEKDPSKAGKLLFRRARIFQQMDFPAKEAVAWQEYLQKFPDTKKKSIITVFLSEALRKWGYLFYSQGNKDIAIEKFESAARTNPANTDAWLWVGRMKSEAKDNTAAADAYMKALEAEPGNKTAIHFLRKFKRQIPPALLTPMKKVAIPAPRKATPAATPAVQVVAPEPATPATSKPAAKPASQPAVRVVTPEPAAKPVAPAPSTQPAPEPAAEVTISPDAPAFEEAPPPPATGSN